VASASGGLREQALAAFTDAAESALENDWQAAEHLLRQRSELQPDYVVPSHLAEKVKQHRRQQFANNDLLALLVLDRIDEATQRQSAGDLEGALQEVERGLNAHGNDPRLLKLRSELHLQIDHRNTAHQERERAERDGYVHAILQSSQQEQDLARQISILEEGLAKYPEEPRLLRQLANRRELSKRVVALVTEAEALEGAGSYKEAIENWLTLQGVLSSYPDLNSNLLRLRKLDEQARAAAQESWIRKVQDALSSSELDRASEFLEQGNQEFAGLPQFDKLQKQLKDGLNARNKALKVVDDARGALSKKKWSKASSYLERARALSGNDPLVREQVLIVLLEGCEAARNVDLEWAEKFLSQAVAVQPDSPRITPQRARVETQRREQIIERHMAAALSAQSHGDLQAAVGEVERGLADVPNEQRLSQLKSELEARIRREQDQLHAVEQAAQSEQRYRDRDETEYQGRTQEEAQPHPGEIAPPAGSDHLFGDTVISEGLPPGAAEIKESEKLPAALPRLELNTRTVVIGLSAVLAVGILLMAWKLSPHAVAVQFRTAPEGATVRINATGQECTTPNCNFKLRPGQYSIEARLQGYETAKATIAVNEWGASSEPIHLKALPVVSSPPPEQPARLAIQGAPPSAEVLLDGKSLGRTNTKGSFTATVPEGSHQVKIQSKDHELATLARTFPAGGSVVLNKHDLSATPIVKPDVSAASLSASVPTVEELDWQRIQNSARIDDWEKFRQRYPNGKYASASQERLDSLYWDKAKNANTAAAFEEYLNKFPNGTHRDEGRENLAWNKAYSTNTVPALRDFLKQYPKGQHNELAAGRIEEMKFEAAKNSDDEALLEGFLRDYPAGDLHNEISRHLDDVVWGKTNKNDLSKVKSYLARFPDGRHAVEARGAIEKPAPATVAKATPAVVDEKPAVLAVIAQYNRAYNDRDIEALRQVWPNMTHQQVSSLGDFFRTATAVQMTYSISDVQVSGRDAVVTLQQSLAYEVSGGWQKAKPVRQVVRLRKTGSNPGDTTWKIDSVQ
jgi:outer membrane protein assembly factor BamD (BamD/ComL family)